MASAQSPSFECSPKALKIGNSDGQSLLAKVQTSYNGVASLRADFDQESYMAALEMGESSSGKMWFSKPGKMRWDYTFPEEQTFTVREKTLWLYQKNENQVLIDDFRNVLITDLPVAFLMGIGDLTKDFKFLKGCETPDGIVVELSPKSQEKLQGFSLLIDTGSSLPIGAKVTDVGGNITSIRLSKLETVSKVEDNIYDPIMPPGADVVDRRKGELMSMAPAGFQKFFS